MTVTQLLDFPHPHQQSEDLKDDVSSPCVILDHDFTHLLILRFCLFGVLVLCRSIP